MDFKNKSYALFLSFLLNAITGSIVREGLVLNINRNDLLDRLEDSDSNLINYDTFPEFTACNKA
ncbi:hypothetical protein [Pseudoalteromonas denitrificans]|jgi:hypothetical protein|uniref:Uncharacterized protein n=1 Tax=Pseudoalteromonas denitrificans DSM 6059 TaxID=1123010 RepID=A0A1I1NSL4_9GAMM|nr:hypothetical protein [Pseudoalteromonas denitrificans]SFD00609.1 hypothetical protein SAMN02745724_03170 [Pseudoalteromonas denitrificans DSM 6059]